MIESLARIDREASAWLARRRSARYALGCLATASLLFIWSPFDATVRGDVGVTALERTTSGLSTGLAVAVATLVIEGGSMLLVWLGMRSSPRLVHLLRGIDDFLTPKKRAGSRGGRSSKLANVLVDGFLALAGGAGFVVLRRPPRPDSGPRPWWRLLGRGAGATGVNMVAFGLVALLGADQVIRATDSAWADWVIEWVPDWKLWTAIIVGPWLPLWIHGRRLSRSGLAELPVGADPTPSP